MEKALDMLKEYEKDLPPRVLEDEFEY